MSCDIAKLINEYELAAKKFRYSESQEWFEQKCKTYEAIVKAVAALEAENASLRERTRWVPVEERLPEDWEDVLINVNNDRHYLALFDCPSEDSIARFIVLPSSKYSPIFSANDVTHWIPLPPAPKEEE